MDWEKATVVTTKFQEIKKTLDYPRPRDTSMSQEEWNTYQCKKAIAQLCDLLDEMAKDNVCENNYVG